LTVEALILMPLASAGVTIRKILLIGIVFLLIGVSLYVMKNDALLLGLIGKCLMIWAALLLYVVDPDQIFRPIAQVLQIKNLHIGPYD
jgi:hypothetical protein